MIRPPRFLSSPLRTRPGARPRGSAGPARRRRTAGLVVAAVVTVIAVVTATAQDSRAAGHPSRGAALPREVGRLMTDPRATATSARVGIAEARRGVLPEAVRLYRLARMTEPTADAPTDTGSDGATPAPTIIILTEEALKPADVDKIMALHEDEAPTYRVLVPADTERNLLSTFLNHLSLFEMREAIDTLRPVDRDEARVDADTALSTTLSELAGHAATATGEITADDPVPALVDEVARLGAREVVIVTEPHAVEDTFHTDWASRAREVLGVPVLHMYAGDWRLG